jgi:hypothetical protein
VEQRRSADRGIAVRRENSLGKAQRIFERFIQSVRGETDDPAANEGVAGVATFVTVT